MTSKIQNSLIRITMGLVTLGIILYGGMSATGHQAKSPEYELSGYKKIKKRRVIGLISIIYMNGHIRRYVLVHRLIVIYNILAL